jgi:hypothetical protein
MNKIAVLNYFFIFKPSETWDSGSKFENDLADFFKSKGYQAQILETVGGTGTRSFWISKNDKLKIPTPSPMKQKFVGDKLKELGKK